MAAGINSTYKIFFGEGEHESPLAAGPQGS